MRRKPKRGVDLLLVLSIVGAILGMEIDVISGPLVSDSFSLVLCDLYAPDSAAHDLSPGVRLPAITIELMSKGGTAQSSDEAGEVPSSFCETDWASALLTAQHRPKDWPGPGINPGAIWRSCLIPHSSPVPRQASSIWRPADLSSKLCRFLC